MSGAIPPFTHIPSRRAEEQWVHRLVFCRQNYYAKCVEGTLYTVNTHGLTLILMLDTLLELSLQACSYTLQKLNATTSVLL